MSRLKPDILSGDYLYRQTSGTLCIPGSRASEPYSFHYQSKIPENQPVKTFNSKAYRWRVIVLVFEYRQ